MARLDDLSHKVEALYKQQLQSRDKWADWLYPNHVVVVATKAKAIAERHGANAELSQVAGLLHDLADFKMERKNPGHEAESLKLARELMAECGYSEQEIALVVDDAIRYHGCHDDERPKSKEGLVLAAADSLAHFQTHYYVFTSWAFGEDGRDLETLRAWALKKIERDLHDKIAFDDVREAVRPNYEMIKRLFSR